MCRRELGEREAAVTAFRRYVALRGSALPASERSEIEAMVRELGGSLDEPARAPTSTSSGLDPIAFWLTAGLAAGAAVALAVTGGLTLSAHDSFVNEGRASTGLRADGLTLETTTNVLIAIAGAAGLAAFVIALFTDFGGVEPQAQARGPSVAVGPGGLVVGW